MIPYIKTAIKDITIKIKTFDKKIIVFNIIDLLLILIIIASYYFTLIVDSKRVVFIPKGSTSSIISYLDKNEYSLNILDKLLVRFIGYPQSGWIDLKTKQMTKFDFLYKLTTSKAALVNITLIPGETYYFFLNELSLKLKISKILLFQTYNKLAFKKDGNIISQTYSLPIGMNADDLITYLFNYTDIQYEKYSLKIFGQYNKEKWYKYITLASIIQKESASKEEMVKISSVIYNRIKKNMKLQMDGTLNYSKYSHTKVTKKMIKNDMSDYNTYKNKGIPNNPICAIEFESIKAAIFPVKTDYLYFVKSKDGTKHIFSNDYKSHKKYINRLKKAKKIRKRTKKFKSKKVYKKFHSKKKKRQKRVLKDIWKSVK